MAEEQTGGWGLAGPPTALQKPGGVGGGRFRCGSRGKGWGGLKRPFKSSCGGNGSSELGFGNDCHLIETVSPNCFLNAGKKRTHQVQ